ARRPGDRVQGPMSMVVVVVRLQGRLGLPKVVDLYGAARRVVAPAALGVGEDLVGLAELARTGAVRVRHRLVEADPAVVRVADLLLGGLRRHSEDGVRVAHDRTLRSRLCSRRHCSIRAWSPESRTSGTRQPLNSAGRVYCGYSTPPTSSAENVSRRADSSASAPGSRRATASTRTIAGSSPPESTYGPIEIASEQSWVTTRSSKPSNLAERSVSCSSAASSSTAAWSSWRPWGVRAITRRFGAPPYTASSAAATTATRSTIPAPPPYGASSTWPFASGVVSR